MQPHRRGDDHSEGQRNGDFCVERFTDGRVVDFRVPVSLLRNFQDRF